MTVLKERIDDKNQKPRSLNRVQSFTQWEVSVLSLASCSKSCDQIQSQMIENKKSMATKDNQEKLLKMAAMIKEIFAPADIVQLGRLIACTPSSGRMSTEEFERLMQNLEASNTRRGFSEKSIQAARLVLVMGASVHEAAAELNLSPQSVYQLMVRIERRIASKPPGWVQVTEWFPVEVAKQLTKIARSLDKLHVTDAAQKTNSKARSFTITVNDKS